MIDLSARFHFLPGNYHYIKFTFFKYSDAGERCSYTSSPARWDLDSSQWVLFVGICSWEFFLHPLKLKLYRWDTKIFLKIVNLFDFVLLWYIITIITLLYLFLLSFCLLSNFFCLFSPQFSQPFIFLLLRKCSHLYFWIKDVQNSIP